MTEVRRVIRRAVTFFRTGKAKSDLGPFVVGWLMDLTGKTSAGLYVVAGLEIVAAVLILLFIPREQAVVRRTT